MLAETLALCERDKDKCNRTDFNLTFLRQAKSRKLSPADEKRIALIYKNLTQTGTEAISEMYAAKVCPIAGECNFFNREEDVFSKWADIQKSQITRIKPIGKPSANGFVRELQIMKEFNEGVRVKNYESHVILKSNLTKDSDNLFFEWLVGLYLNRFMDRFPIFCKTYGLYEYSSDADKTLMLESPEVNGLAVIKRLNVVTEANGIQKSVQTPERLCVVVQHVHQSISLFDLIEEYDLLYQTIKDVTLLDSENVTTLSKLLDRNEEDVKLLLPALQAKPRPKRLAEMLLLKREIVCALYQIYFVLGLMPGFSHNDLHPGNVILTPAGENKHYEFHYNDKSFQCKNAAKLIDYGRCSFTESPSIKHKVDTFIRENLIQGDTDVLAQLEKIETESGFPWQYVETENCATLDFRLINACITYGILKEGVLKNEFLDDTDGFYGKLETSTLPPYYLRSPCDNLTRRYLTSLHKKRHIQYVKKGTIYPTIRSVAPALYTEIEPYEFENSQCFCKIYISDQGKMNIVWPTAMSAGKTRKRRKTRKTLK